MSTKVIEIDERSEISVRKKPQTRITIAVVLAFVAIYVVWGSTYLAIRYAVETIPPLLTAGTRHLTAGTILLLWCLGRGQKPTREQWKASVMIGVLFFLIGHGTLHWAERIVPSGLAALLVATEPIWVFVLSAAADRRWRLNLSLVLGFVLGLAGVGLLFRGHEVISGRGMLSGSIAVLIGGLSWAAGIVYSRRSRLSGHPMLLSALSLVSGGVMLLISGLIFGETRHLAFSSISQRSIAGLAYMIVFGSILAFTAYNWLLERFSPTLVATHTYVNPIVAVLLGWWLAGERLSMSLGLAAVMIVGAVVLIERGGRDRVALKVK
jgi:drug/metabolite transporter (DMT)-like permease